MAGGISTQARTELLGALRERYRSATRAEKGRILDEFVAVAKCHRKHAVRLLKRAEEEHTGKPQPPSRRVYDEAVREALIVIWEAADRICAKRLKAVLPELVEAMQRHGHLELGPEVHARLLAVSASSMDRLLVAVRRKAGSRRKRQVRRKVKARVPVRTFADWDEPLPGYLEIDFVAHGGGAVSGTFIYSLVATDVCSGWTEAVPLLVREQGLVTQGLDVIARQLPVTVRGIDTDNDSAFLNDTLVDYCTRRHIEFTRSRAYRKNDQAWIEQKNGTFVRRFVGYERYAGPVAGQALAHLYAAVRQYVNFFQPSFKLVSKTREGARVTKRYRAPATPCERLVAHEAVDMEVKNALRTQRLSLDPVALLHTIREAQSALVAIARPEAHHDVHRVPLEQFLSRLPDMWRMGEVRPTHLPRRRSRKYWRTRKDPFEGVWPQVLRWLQQEPDVTAKALFERLRTRHPNRFEDGQLRTLQRRVRQWRHVMARELVFGCLEDSEPWVIAPVETERTTADSPGTEANQDAGMSTPDESAWPVHAPHSPPHQGRTYPPLAPRSARV